MKIYDYHIEFEAQDQAALDKVLQRHLDHPSNYFNLSHDGSDYPLLSILAKGERACVHYFPGDGHPGHFALVEGGAAQSAQPEPFYLSPGGESIEVYPHMVVPFAIAERAAREFFTSSDLPGSVDWFEL